MNRQDEIKQLINNWCYNFDGAKHRDKLKREAKAAGFMLTQEYPDVGAYVESVFVANSDLEYEVGIHELAKEMISVGYKGNGLREQDKAYDYILLAANNPDVESELPEAGFLFWKAAAFQFKIWKARLAIKETSL